jgi:hypothetical protein
MAGPTETNMTGERKMSGLLRTLCALLVLSTVVAACAVRVGGGGPREYSALALQAAGGTAPEAVAREVAAAGADLVLLSADADSAWFASVAQAAGLELSGPGLTSGRGLAFLGNLELLGDSTLALDVAGGGSVHMHDALYKGDGGRYVNTMMVRFDAPDLRQAVRTLLDYVSTDVMATAAVLLAVEADTPMRADSAANLMRVLFAPALECARDGSGSMGPGGIRLLVGPVARMTCREARFITGEPAGIHATVILSR